MSKVVSDKSNLLVATEMGHSFIVMALLDAPDVNLNVKTNFGQTTFSFAAEK